MTSHAKDVAEREARMAQLEADRAQPVKWRELMGRPLAHSIRFTLDVELPRDVAWLESCRDEAGEVLLAQLRGRLGEVLPSDWAMLRESKEHVWRVLVGELRLYRISTRPPVASIREADAYAMARSFCHE